MRSIIFFLCIWLSCMCWANKQESLKALAEVARDFQLIEHLYHHAPQKRLEAQQRILNYLRVPLDLGSDPDPMIEHQVEQLAAKLSGFLERLIEQADTLELLMQLDVILMSNWLRDDTRSRLLELMEEQKSRVPVSLRSVAGAVYRQERWNEQYCVDVTGPRGARFVLNLCVEYEDWRPMRPDRDCAPSGDLRQYSPRVQSPPADL